MKCNLILFFESLLLLFVSHATFAADDTTEIQLNYTYTEYLNFIGSAAGASRYFTPDAISPIINTGPPSGRIGKTVNLGTLGLNSNIFGDCTLAFTTTNNFELRHATSGQSLASYKLEYRNTDITSGSNQQITLPCSSAASDIDLTTIGNFKRNPKAGAYQDIVNIVVTTQ